MVGENSRQSRAWTRYFDIWAMIADRGAVAIVEVLAPAEAVAKSWVPGL
jgi:hypothetical protein